jgi:ATP-binding cassette, subfamily B, bacterial PglK
MSIATDRVSAPASAVGAGVPRSAIPAGTLGLALYGLLPAGIRRRWLLLAALAGLYSLAELVTMVLLLAVLRLATEPGGGIGRALKPWGAGPELLLTGGRTAALASAVIGSVFLVRAALAVAVTATTNTATVGTGIFINELLLRRYVHMAYAQFRQHRVADLQRRTTELSRTVVGHVFRPAVQIVTDTTVIVSVLAVMVIASPWGTLAAAALVATVSGILLRAVSPRLYRVSSLIDRHDRSADLFVDQVLHGRREITLRHHEAPVVSSYLEERRAVSRPSRDRAVLLDLPRIVIEGLSLILVTALVIFTVGLGLDTPRVVATLGLFAYALLRLMPLTARIASNLAALRSGRPILDILMQDLLPAGGGAVTAPVEAAPPAESKAPVVVDAIEFRAVSFRYEGAREDALRDVTARIEAGSFVAVVGPSGAGKSTFVDLLLGLLVPTSGDVLLDGRDLARMTDGWQGSVGVVSQEPYIFNASILRNVALFAAEVDERRVVEVLQQVGLWDLVHQLPHGLDTELGERGATLSGGQRQRLAMARALFSDPSVLILDEATSALDPDGEATVMRAALRRERPRTVVAVTHRLSAIADCDQIIVLEDGGLTATGSHREVLRKSPYFARLVETAVRGGDQIDRGTLGA